MQSKLLQQVKSMLILLIFQGKRYRFRVIYNAPIFCHIQISIDKHPMTVINTDSANIKPIEGNFIIYNLDYIIYYTN